MTSAETIRSMFIHTSREYLKMGAQAANATATVVENRMEPVQKQEPTQQPVVTGQYLYDTFMVADQGEKTRMGVIRSLVDKADALQIKGACDKMVEKAREVDAANGVPEKTRGPKTQAAMNARTIIQQAWGALRFARDELNAEGYSDETGYLTMRVIAKRALDKKGVKWSGEALLSAADREARKAAREQKAEKAVLESIMKKTPRKPDESLRDYNIRVAELADAEIAKVRAEEASNFAAETAMALIEKHGRDRALKVAMALLDALGLEIDNPSELSEEETNAALASYAAAEDTQLQPETETAEHE